MASGKGGTSSLSNPNQASIIAAMNPNQAGAVQTSGAVQPISYAPGPGGGNGGSGGPDYSQPPYGYPPSAYGTPGTTPYPQTHSTPGYEPQNPMTDPMGEPQQYAGPIEWTDPGSRPVPGQPKAADKKEWWKGAAEGAQAWAQSSSRLATGGGGIGGLPSIDARMGDLILRPNPAFPLTPGQSKILARMGVPSQKAHTFIANQILSGNPNYGPYTSQQIAAARALSSGASSGEAG